MDLVGHKVTALFLSWVLMGLAFLLAIPLGGKVKKAGAKGKLILDCCNCFGGGVFLGLFLLNAIPEAKELMNDALLEPEGIDYPVTEVLMAAGFFLIMLIEILTYEFVIKKNSKIHLSGSVPDSLGGEGNQHELEDKASIKHSTTEIERPYQSSPAEVSPTEIAGGEVERVNKLTVVVLLIALSVECVFEGMALGLMSSVNDVWIMFAGILSHEVIICFCLGMEFFKYVSTTWVVIFGLIYSSTVAIGIAIGLGVYEAGSGADLELTQGIILSLAAGVFLYCTFLGIINKQLGHGSHLLKYLLFFAGFSLMACLAAIPE